MAVALKAENVSIRYITGDFKDIGIKEYAVRKLTKNYLVKEFMAVDGVTFALESGDMLGIIGTNGAGKSTLLKAVAGIMEPTRGKIVANGEVVALLELGSGFDGDLTVRENAYLRGAMLGYTQKFMDETYAQIIDFAELWEFEDRPFKQLSSGMKSRLAFSIASLVNPDILILDEVLSVGDGAFQEKSAQKMREIISQGATTILVSHSLSQIRELCNKVLWLDHGKQIAFGETQEICDQYERFLRGECPAEMPGRQTVVCEQTVATAPEAVASRDDTPVQKRSWKRALIAALVLALFTGVVSYTTVNNIQANQKQTQSVYITAEDLSAGAVTYRGAYVDDSWYSPHDTVGSDGTWRVDVEQDVRIATDDKPLEVRLPRGGSRYTLIFGSGPQKGRVTVMSNGNTAHFELFNEGEVPLGLGYEVSDLFEGATVPQNTLSIRIALTLALIVFALATILALMPPPQVRRAKSRDVWGELFRGVCCFVIVLLHCTCNIYNTMPDGFTAWLPHLFMNSFTAFAVPCFFMLSGAFLLRREHGVKETLLKRIPKSLVPLLFWSVCYILLSGQIEGPRFILMFFQEQTSHLWFMYCILAIYVLLPLISRLYCSLTMKMKLYLLAVLLILPTLLHDTEFLIDYYVTMPRFAIFWPDLGLFFLGAVIWDLRHIVVKRWWCILGFAAGFGLTITQTICMTLRMGAPDKTFFSIGSIGPILMAVSVFFLCLSLRKTLQRLPTMLTSFICLLGETSFGVYLIHILLLQSLNTDVYPYIPLHANQGSLFSMTIAALVYFLLSVLVCWSGRQVQFFRRMF